MKVWIMTGVNNGNEESCDYRRTLAVFDHEPDVLEQLLIRADAIAADRWGHGFDDYEVEDFEVLSR